jgi:signal peptidase I
MKKGLNQMDNKDIIPETEKIVEEVAKKSIGKEILEWIFSIVIAIVIALIIRQFIFTVVKVDGASMQPTLQHNDRLIVWRLGYKPDNGDIIVLHQEGKLPYIKRIIAVEGQTVDINFVTHKVYVDGVELDENYIKEPTMRSGDVQFPVTVDEGCVFVLGDNRNDSRDSRFSDVGMVKREDILGKTILRFFPFSEIKTY